MNLEKYAAKSGEAKAMIHHYYKNWERTKDRHLIDMSKNGDNYQISLNGSDSTKLVKHDIDIAKAEHNAVVSKIPKARKLRRDAPVLADIIITATPEMLDTFEHRKQLPMFFQETFNHFAKDLEARGLNLEKSRLTGFVHMNESKPQMHLAFIPVDTDGKINFRNIIKRDFYQDFHEDLSKHLEQTLGRKLSILIEDDKDINRMLKRAGVSQKTYKKVKDCIRADLTNENADLAKQKECLRQDIASLEKSCRKTENELDTGCADTVRQPTTDEITTEQNRRFSRRVGELSSDIRTLKGQSEKIERQCSDIQSEIDRITEQTEQNID